MNKDYVLSRFNYDKAKGCLIWKTCRKESLIGSVAGSLNGSGYLTLRLKGKSFRVHHLIWLIEGELPKSQIDHIDTNRSNNRFSNLRLSTQRQNTYNRSMMSNNVSGVKGVHWHSRSRKWRAVVVTDGVKKQIGMFDTPESAQSALHEHRMNQHGDFARSH